MKNKHKVYITIISAILLSLLSFPVYAQTPSMVTAEVDRYALTTDEFLTLSVSINTGNGPASEPALPSMDGFDIVGTSTSTQVSIINGAISSEKVFHYTLHPRVVGELIIGPISITQNGQAHATNPIKVNVTPGTGQKQSPPQSRAPGFPSMPSIPGFPSLSGLLKNFGLDIPVDIQDSVEPLDPALIPPELLEHEYLVEAEVDNDSPYLGQQVTYTFRYYRPASSAGRSTYEPPEYSGFWVHPESSENTYGGQFAGRNIRMTEIQTILTPTVLGEVVIDPAKISSEGDFLSRGFTIQTQPKTISVQPLPGGAPAGFSGAVGNFSISAAVDLHQTKVNDAVTFTVTIDGQGNLDTFADPQWEIGPQWRAFDSQSATDIQSQAGVISGSRTIEQVLVPTVGGEFTLPAIQFSYFDPQSGTYQTVETEPILISVEQDEQTAAPISIDAPTTKGTNAGRLHPIKISPGTGQAPSLYAGNPGFWLLWLVPLTFIIAQFGWQRRKKNILNNPAAQRSQKAAKKANLSLKKLDPKSDNYFNAAGRVLIDYLSDKLDRPVGGLTQAELSGLLLAHGVSEDLVNLVRSCITISEMGQYAPIQQANINDIHQEIKSLIAELDKIL
jgi:hypothetical protein